MTKADLIEAVRANIGNTSKAETAEIVETVLETIKDTLEAGEDVKVSGFGKFQVRQKRARRGRNPQSGEAIVIAPRRVLTFKASPLLKDALNASGEK